MEQKDYFVRHPKQVVNNLKRIQELHCSLLVTLDNQQSYLSAILEIDAKNNLFKFDCSRSEQVNRQLLNSSKVLFRTEVDGIKVSFKAGAIKQSGDKSFFSMPIPEVLYWMQRRDCYRIRVPINHYCGLHLVLKSSGKNYTMETFTKKYRLIDVSVDGFAFMSVDNDLQWHYEANIEKLQDKVIQGTLVLREFEDCQSEIEFVIRNVEKLSTPGHYRVGCQFSEITPLFQSELQRYMQRVELDAKAKE